MKIERNTASTVRIDHPTASYAIFCFNEKGDLFVNSDWGFYGYAWRAFGDHFENFLSGTNAEYVVGKFGTTYLEAAGKRLPKTREENLLILTREFISTLKNQQANATQSTIL